MATCPEIRTAAPRCVLMLTTVTLLLLVAGVGFTQQLPTPQSQSGDPDAFTPAPDTTGTWATSPPNSLAMTMEEVDYRQVCATLESPLLDEFEAYRTEGIAIQDGFAGYMLKDSSRRYTRGQVMLKVGMTFLVVGAVGVLTGLGWMAATLNQPVSHIDIGAIIATIAGGGVLAITIPVVVIGSMLRKKGKKRKKRLENLIQYRHTVPVEVWATQPIPSN